MLSIILCSPRRTVLLRPSSLRISCTCRGLLLLQGARLGYNNKKYYKDGTVCRFSNCLSCSHPGCHLYVILDTTVRLWG
jgi:hypothetical protein